MARSASESGQPQTAKQFVRPNNGVKRRDRLSRVKTHPRNLRNLHDHLGSKSLVRLVLWRSRALSQRHEGDDVLSNLTQQPRQLVKCLDASRQPARQTLADMRKRPCAIDLERSPGVGQQNRRRIFADLPLALLKGLKTQQRIEVIGNHLGAEVLLMGLPAHTGNALQLNAMFDTLEGFLDAPALVVQRAKFGGGPLDGIEQIGRQHANEALASDRANQAHRHHTTFDHIIGRIQPVGRWQDNDGLINATAHKRLDGIAADAIQAGAKSDLASLQRRHQPRARIAPIEYQQIIAPEHLQVLKQHLPLARIRAIQRSVQHHFNTGQIQREDLGATNQAARGIVGHQAHITGIDGHHAQAMPARYADVSFKQRKQSCIQIAEHRGRQILARLGQSLSADAAQQLGLIVEYGEETIELGLHTGAIAADEPADEGSEIKDAFAAEVPRIGDVAQAQCSRVQH